MSSVLGLNLKNRSAIVILEKGEYELSLTRTIVQRFEDDNVTEVEYPKVNVVFEAVGKPNADDIFHTIWLPKSDDTEKQVNKRLNEIAEFLTFIGLDPDDEANEDPAKWSALQP